MDDERRQSLKTKELFDNKLSQLPDIVVSYSKTLYNLSINTQYDRIRVIDRLLAKSKKDIKDLTYDDFFNFLSDTSIGRCAQRTKYFNLKPFCTYLYKNKIISENYMEDIPLPKMVETKETIEKRNNGYLTIDEMKLVMNEINKDDTALGIRDQALFSFMLNSGIRESALLNINIQDYDRVKRCITVTEKEELVREYCLSLEVCKLIDKWLNIRNMISSIYTDQLFLHLSLEDIDPDMIICGPYLIYNKRAYTYREFTKGDLYKTVLNRTSCVEGKHITPHKLRATYGTQIYEKTKDLYFTQKCMGHRSPQTTEKYIRSNVNPTIEASNIMTNLLT